MTSRLRKLGPVACLVVALGIAASASVAYAATLSVTSARLTTYSVAVTIDPTVCTLTPVADATVDRNAATTNFGNLTTLSVRRQASNRQKRSLVRFNVASCGIPGTAQIVSSSLRMTVITPPGSNQSYGAHRITGGAWVEGTVTYNTQPASAAAATSTVATGASPTSLTWSVLADVDAYVKGTAVNNGWVIRDAAETSNPAVETVFGSRQNGTAGNRPSLVISYYP